MNTILEKRSVLLQVPHIHIRRGLVYFYIFNILQYEIIAYDSQARMLFDSASKVCNLVPKLQQC